MKQKKIPPPIFVCFELPKTKKLSDFIFLTSSETGRVERSGCLGFRLLNIQNVNLKFSLTEEQNISFLVPPLSLFLFFSISLFPSIFLFHYLFFLPRVSKPLSLSPLLSFSFFHLFESLSHSFSFLSLSLPLFRKAG